MNHTKKSQKAKENTRNPKISGVFLGAAGRIRTADLILTNVAMYKKSLYISAEMYRDFSLFPLRWLLSSRKISCRSDRSVTREFSTSSSEDVDQSEGHHSHDGRRDAYAKEDDRDGLLQTHIQHRRHQSFV